MLSMDAYYSSECTHEICRTLGRQEGHFWYSVHVRMQQKKGGLFRVMSRIVDRLADTIGQLNPGYQYW